MTPIAAVEAIATLLWSYAGICLVVWTRHLVRAPKGDHIPHVTDLIANMVPAMIMLLVVVIAGAILGFPTVVVLIAVLFPAGLAAAFHMSLNDIRDSTSYRVELIRIAVAMGVGLAVIFVRQVV